MALRIFQQVAVLEQVAGDKVLEPGARGVRPLLRAGGPGHLRQRRGGCGVGKMHGHAFAAHTMEPAMKKTSMFNPRPAVGWRPPGCSAPPARGATPSPRGRFPNTSSTGRFALSAHALGWPLAIITRPFPEPQFRSGTEGHPSADGACDASYGQFHYLIFFLGSGGSGCRSSRVIQLASRCRVRWVHRSLAISAASSSAPSRSAAEIARSMNTSRCA